MKKTKIKIPNPGSDEAIELGCLCPVMDNAHGKGIGLDGKTFWISFDCKMHYGNGDTELKIGLDKSKNVCYTKLRGKNVNQQ